MKKKSYIVFPIVGILCVIMKSMYSYIRQTKDNNIILKEFDITGMTTVFLIIMSIITIAIFLVCIYNAKKAESYGYNYKLNKIFTIIFLGLAITSYISFAVIRSEEEKIAEKLNNKLQEYEEAININNKKALNKINQMIQEQESDKFHTRKLQIISQINDNSEIERYIYLFIYWPMYNETINNRNLLISPSDENSYYAIFSGFAVIHIISFAFYFVHIKDEDTELKLKILDENI